MVGIGFCGLCEMRIFEDEKFYKQTLAMEGKSKPVILCEDCMAEMHKCGQCGEVRPYCTECV